MADFATKLGKGNACRNCLFVSYILRPDADVGQKKDWHCKHDDFYGLPVYPWDCCANYRKLYHRNRQIDVQDVYERNADCYNKGDEQDGKQ